MKACTGCGEELPLAEFVRDARRSDGHGSVCRSCMSARVVAGKRGERNRRLDPRPWHQGCRRCGEYERNSYPGKACKHPGAVQGVLELHGGNNCTFISEGSADFSRSRDVAGVGSPR